MWKLLRTVFNAVTLGYYRTLIVCVGRHSRLLSHIDCVRSFWAVFPFAGSGPALTAYGSLDRKQESQIQIVCVGRHSRLLSHIDCVRWSSL
jgi:hypothetical protein